MLTYAFMDHENTMMNEDPDSSTNFETDDLAQVHVFCILLKLSLGQTLLDLDSSLKGLSWAENTASDSQQPLPEDCQLTIVGSLFSWMVDKQLFSNSIY